MKILWLSNRLFSSIPDKSSGTWLSALALKIANYGSIDLYNISFGNDKSIIQCDFEKISQWSVPENSLAPGGLPDNNTQKEIFRIIENISPDIIHIWGTESYWARLLQRTENKYVILLSIQGVISSVAEKFSGGLGFLEKIKCLGLRELIYPKDSIFIQKLLYDKLSKVESYVLKKCNYISVQSNWTESQINQISQYKRIFRVSRMLRDQFYECKPWFFPFVKNDNDPILFTFFGNPYKGFHDTLKAIKILKIYYPNIVLKVAGHLELPNIKSTGYKKYIWNLIYKYDLNKNIKLLGNIDATQLVHELQNSNVFLHSSYVESFSLSVAESLAVGVPTVSTNAGALPEMNGCPDNILFYSPGDYNFYAYQINKFIKDQELSCLYSTRGRNFIQKKCSAQNVLLELINQYKELANIKCGISK